MYPKSPMQPSPLSYVLGSNASTWSLEAYPVILMNFKPGSYADFVLVPRPMCFALIVWRKGKLEGYSHYFFYGSAAVLVAENTISYTGALSMPSKQQ